MTLRQSVGWLGNLLLVAGPLHSWPATFLQGNAAAAGTALINSMGALGGFIGPALIGYLADDNDDDDYDAAMMAISIFLMCAAVLMLGETALLCKQKQSA